MRIAFVEEEERAALRVFLRALRRLDHGARWEALVKSPRAQASTTPLRHELRNRVLFFDDVPEAAAGRRRRRACSPDGVAPGAGAGAARDRGGGGAAGHQPRRLRGDHRGGRPRTAIRAARRRHLRGAAAAADRRRAAARRLRAAAEPLRKTLSWERLVDETEDVYDGLVGRRHDGRGSAAVRKRLQSRPRIDVDLHMHTDHSHDCATPVEVLLATPRVGGLGAIAVTDHNEISGALEAASKAAEFGVKVIVGEEVKTASQGEVIGLFLTEKIPRGLTMAETVAEIKRQGGLVYVPHPFDRMHAVPDYEHLLEILDDVDAIEIYNPRVAIGSFNEEAERFAAKYRIVAGAGSDSHVAQGLGSVRISMPDFDGPEEFLEALRDRRDQPRPVLAALRAGAEVPRDEGDPARRAPRAPRPTGPPGDAQGLMHDEGRTARASNLGRRGAGGGDSAALILYAQTDDEIREKYLERADPRAQHPHAGAPGLRALPARRTSCRCSDRATRRPTSSC